MRCEMRCERPSRPTLPALLRPPLLPLLPLLAVLARACPCWQTEEFLDYCIMLCDEFPSCMAFEIEDGGDSADAHEVLPLAPQPKAPTPQEVAKTESQRQREKDDHCLRELRICFRAVLDVLRKEKRYATLWRPVDPEEVPDYYEIISQPIDLETIRAKVDACPAEECAPYTSPDRVCTCARV